MNRIARYISAVLCAVMPALGGDCRERVELSLDECCSLAMQNNVKVRNARLDVLAARAQRG